MALSSVLHLLHLTSVCAVHVAAGRLHNQTVLPLPPVGEADLSGGTPSTEAVHLLEAALVTWTQQLRAVLMRDPESAAAEMGGAQPGPLAELDYWADRSAQLKGIWEQLARPQVQQIMRALEACRSSYLPAFARLCSEVDAARSVAAESSKLLLPLRKPLEKLHSIDDFPALASIFRPILHTLLLIWQHSKQYSSAPRLVALVRQICNGLIQQARRFCPGRCPPQGLVEPSGIAGWSVAFCCFAAAFVPRPPSHPSSEHRLT